MKPEYAYCVNWMRIIVTISVLFGGSYSALAQAPASTTRLPADVEQAIHWLPENTESIMVARGPLQDGVLKDFRDPRPSPFVSIPAAPPSRTNGPAKLGPPTVAFPPEPKLGFQQEILASATWLFGLAGKAFSENISKHKVRLVVAGARRFGVPVIGRASTYEGCELILFDTAVCDVGIQAKPKERLSIEQMENNRVVRIDTDVEWGDKDEKISIWYAKPKPNILIAATHAGFLRTMLQRVAHLPAARTPLLDFPEWRYVDTQASAWGIRHRRTATPIWTVAKAWEEPLPPTALNGITYYYRPRPSNSIVLRWHFSEQSRAALPRAIKNDPKTKLITPLVTEQKLVIREPSDAGEGESLTPDYASFWLSHLMGYVVCP